MLTERLSGLMKLLFFQHWRMDSTWIATVAGADGVLTLAEMQASVDRPDLTEQQQETLLYLVENFNELSQFIKEVGSQAL